MSGLMFSRLRPSSSWPCSRLLRLGSLSLPPLSRSSASKMVSTALTVGVLALASKSSLFINWTAAYCHVGVSVISWDKPSTVALSLELQVSVVCYLLCCARLWLCHTEENARQIPVEKLWIQCLHAKLLIYTLNEQNMLLSLTCSGATLQIGVDNNNSPDCIHTQILTLWLDPFSLIMIHQSAVFLKAIDFDFKLLFIGCIHTKYEYYSNINI